MIAELFNHLWQSTVFAVTVALLTLMFRLNRARLRYGLWFAASVKFLLPFAALAALGSFVPWQQAPAPLRSAVASSAARDFNAPFDVLWLDPTPMAAATASPQWIAPVLFGVWLCGFTAIVLRRLWQWREIRAAVRASTPYAAATLAPDNIEIRTLPTAPGTDLKVGLYEPGVVGLWRPVILLPAGIENYLTADQLAAVVAHEVCHVRRRDNLTASIHMAVEALFWFHPIVWWIGARLVTTREQACDEHVIAETAAPLAYAEGIAGVCRRYVETPLMSVAGVGGADVKARIDAILARRIGLRLTLPKRLALAVVAALTLLLPVVTGAIEAAAFAAGQQPAGGSPIDPQVRFEVASVKPVAGTTGTFGRFLPLLPRFEYIDLPIGWFLRTALDKPAYRMIGAPGWVDTDHYTIMAKAPDGVPQAALATLMLNLLKDRFQLATHLETRELPIFNLVMARTDRRPGPSLQTTPADCQATVAERITAQQAFAAGRGAPPPLPGRPGGPPAPNPDAILKGAPPPCGMGRFLTGNVAASGQTMAQLVTTLADWVGRPVLDKTGLTGLYDFTLKFSPEGIRAAGPMGPTLTLLQGQGQAPATDPNAPSLAAALEEQLGLKLEPGRGPVEVVVIDRLEKPAPD